MSERLAYKVVTTNYRSTLVCGGGGGRVLQYNLGELVGPVEPPGIFAYHELGSAVARWARRPHFERRRRIIVVEYQDEDVYPSRGRASNVRTSRVQVIGEVSYDEILSVLEARDPRWAAWARGQLGA